MDDFMTSRYKRRLFFVIAVVASLAILSVRFYVLPHFAGETVPPTSAIVASILDTLFTSLVAAVSITALVFWLTPPNTRTAVMEVVGPTEIPETLKEALDQTREWWYRGHSGRHFRAVTLPQLADDARAHHVAKKVVLQILDPTSQKTCDDYAAYRQRLRSAIRDQPWSADRVRLELYATVISVSAWKTKDPWLDVTLALIPAVSLFRVDLSSRLAIITKEDPREPALRCDEGTIFYNSYREERYNRKLWIEDSLKNVVYLPFEQSNGKPTRQRRREGHTHAQDTSGRGGGTLARPRRDRPSRSA